MNQRGACPTQHRIGAPHGRDDLATTLDELVAPPRRRRDEVGRPVLRACNLSRASGPWGRTGYATVRKRTRARSVRWQDGCCPAIVALAATLELETVVLALFLTWPVSHSRADADDRAFIRMERSIMVKILRLRQLAVSGLLVLMITGCTSSYDVPRHRPPWPRRRRSDGLHRGSAARWRGSPTAGPPCPRSAALR